MSDFHKMTEREARRLQGLARLASVIAHKMNSDLTEITCNVGLILEDLETGQPPEDLREMLQDCLSSALRASRLSQEALGLFRLDTSVAKPILLSKYLTQAPSRIVSGVECTYDFGAGDVQIVILPGHLDMIVGPVLTNASEALDETVAIATSPCRVSEAEQPDGAMDVLEDGEYVRISVRDRGPGISLPSFEQAFSPFVTNKESSLGLGLATALTAARTYRGTMACRNHPEGGAEFSIWLPVGSPEG